MNAAVMRQFALLILVGLTGPFFVRARAVIAESADAMPLKVAIFDVDVSPPLGSPLAYDDCVGVAMPLRAKGIVISSEAEPIVLCAVDWIGISNSAHDRWRSQIAAAADTAIERVAVHTLHQHDAPFCDFAAESIMAEQGLSGRMFDVKFSQEVIAKVAAAVEQALQRMKVVTHIGLGQATVEKVASNRRIVGIDGKVRATRYTACRDPQLRLEPEGIIDSRLKSISFWNEEQLLTVLTYYATHPQSYYRRGIANPDFPGMARFVRQVTLNGIPHIHFNGAGGNIGAGKYNDGSPDNRQRLATRLADAMARALESTDRHPITSGDISWHRRSIPIAPAPHLSSESLVATITNSEAPPLDRRTAAVDLSWLQRCEAGVALDVTCLRLGPASIVHLPGEAVVEYQLYAQELHPDQFIAVAAYGDYGTGYICLEQHYRQGGYEASERASRVSPSTEHVLKDAIRTVLADSEPQPLNSLAQ